MLAGLADPQDSVIVEALRSLASLEGLESGTARAITARLEYLVGHEGRLVREAVVFSARRLYEEAPADQRLKRVVKRARSDRSWLVRAASEN